MSNRITLADIDGRIQYRDLVLPDGYRLFHSSVYEWRKVGIKSERGAVVGEYSGTRREVYDALSHNSSRPQQWAESAWLDAISDAIRDGKRIVTGSGWTVRITPKFFFVSFDDGKVKVKTSRRLPRSASTWEIVRIIMG